MQKKWFKTGMIILTTVLTTGCTTGNQTVLSTLNQGTTSSEEREETSVTEEETETVIESRVEATPTEASNQKEEKPVNTDKLIIHICGAVKAPGVFQMDTGSRVIDAVQKAGGFTEDASQDFVNLATRLADGTKIVIPTIEEAKSLKQENAFVTSEVSISGSQNLEGNLGNTKVNINTATEDELCTLTGIGASRAKAIISYREQAGGFQKMEDIMNVEGIKEGSFQKIKDFITVD